MKYHANVQRSNHLTSVRIVTSIVAFVLVSYWICSDAALQAETVTSHENSSATPSHLPPQGIVRPCREVTMSVPLQGMLKEILVESGDLVKKGQILANMDNRIAAASVDAARAMTERTAEINHAKHALALADSLFARHRALQAAHAGAGFELEQAKAQRDQAEATLASAMEVQLQAQRNLALEETRLEVNNIRAPFDGEVVRIQATGGTTLTPSDELITLVSLDSLEADLYLPLELFGKLQVGKSYKLRAFEPVNRVISARLTFASPMVDPAAKTFRCVFRIENQDRRLPAGFGVRLDLSNPGLHKEAAL